jgi:hypothetical protein
LSNIDKYCVFIYSVKSLNKYTFSIGTNKSIHLTFNKLGNLISDKSYAKFCQNKSFTFNLHTKSTDNIEQSKEKQEEQEQDEWLLNRNKIFKNENLFLNLKKMQRNRLKKAKPKFKLNLFDTNVTINEFSFSFLKNS